MNLCGQVAIASHRTNTKDHLRCNRVYHSLFNCIHCLVREAQREQDTQAAPSGHQQTTRRGYTSRVSSFYIHDYLDHVLVGALLHHERKYANMFSKGFLLVRSSVLGISEYSSWDIIKHFCYCSCHSASRSFSWLQGSLYPLLLVSSLILVSLCWVCFTR
jgi:hypothetical protein